VWEKPSGRGVTVVELPVGSNPDATVTVCEEDAERFLQVWKDVYMHGEEFKGDEPSRQDLEGLIQPLIASLEEQWKKISRSEVMGDIKEWALAVWYMGKRNCSFPCSPDLFYVYFQKALEKYVEDVAGRFLVLASELAKGDVINKAVEFTSNFTVENNLSL
jgi:hypothetical protein